MSGNTILTTGGLNVLAVDPGTCTGWALYEGRSQRVFWDEWYGLSGVDSNIVNKRVTTLAKTPVLELYRRERAIARRLMEIVYLSGPNTTVVFEDFVLGVDGDGRGGYGGRTGLSPVRVTTAFLMLWEERGVEEGDMWRTWNCGLRGFDQRGYHVSGAGAEYWGMSAVDRAKVARFQDGAYGSGGASFMKPQMPSLRKSVGCNDDWLRQHGWWVRGCKDARSALSHLRYATRGLGLRIDSKPESWRRTLRGMKDPVWISGS